MSVNTKLLYFYIFTLSFMNLYSLCICNHVVDLLSLKEVLFIIFRFWIYQQLLSP